MAKTLRETFHPMHKKKKEEAGHSEHMCGMMAMQTQGGLGHEDLNELMKVRKTIAFLRSVTITSTSHLLFFISKGTRRPRVHH